MDEWTFWHKELKEPLSLHGHVDRIESHAVSIGRPDINFCSNSGVISDIEMKSMKEADLSTRLKVRATQYQWFRHRSAVKGRCFILARVELEKEGPVWLLIPGSKVAGLVTGDWPGWQKAACRTWKGKFNVKQLVDKLESYKVV